MQIIAALEEIAHSPARSRVGAQRFHDLPVDLIIITPDQLEAHLIIIAWRMAGVAIGLPEKREGEIIAGANLRWRRLQAQQFQRPDRNIQLFGYLQRRAVGRLGGRRNGHLASGHTHASESAVRPARAQARAGGPVVEADLDGVTARRDGGGQAQLILHIGPRSGGPGGGGEEDLVDHERLGLAPGVARVVAQRYHGPVVGGGRERRSPAQQHIQGRGRLVQSSRLNQSSGQGSIHQSQLAAERGSVGWGGSGLRVVY